jgi:nucleotidyltransferase/DNA polymerase involved in DNA repair
MAELAALGLAGNIITFIDFGVKLFREGQQIYASASGTTEEQTELEAITTDIKLLAQKLQPSLNATATLTRDESELRRLAQGCEELTEDLLKVLRKLRGHNGGNRKWESFKQALGRVLKEKEIRNLEERLARYQNQIGQRLIYLLRYVVLSKEEYYADHSSAINSLLY